MDKLDLVPQEKTVRNLLRIRAGEFVARKKIVAPINLESLVDFTKEFCEENKVAPEFFNWCAVMINNEAWREEFIQTPKPRRVLLLAQCLKNSKSCRAKLDEFGLLCEGCGACKISGILDCAESNGLVSLVAESTGFVEKLIDEGKIDAVIGVSCMDSLSRSFKTVVRRGVCSIAIPLLRCGCKDTDLDEDWVLEAICAAKKGFSMPSDAAVKQEMEKIFSSCELEKFLGKPFAQCEKIAIDYLANGGNRWRPRLFVSAYCALKKCGLSEIPLEIKKAAVALECFHKASLIHDDFEDSDDERNSQPTLHKTYGAPFAINVGDWLLGVGYSLLGGANLHSQKLCELASSAHKMLASGQGFELEKLWSAEEVSVENLVELFKRKTAEAFKVALLFAAECADKLYEYETIFNDYANNLGIAYQFLDDIKDKDNYSNKNGVKKCVYILSRDELLVLYERYRAKTYSAIDCVADAPLRRLLFSMAGRILENVS